MANPPRLVQRDLELAWAHAFNTARRRNRRIRARRTAREAEYVVRRFGLLMILPVFIASCVWENWPLQFTADALTTLWIVGFVGWLALQARAWLT